MPERLLRAFVVTLGLIGPAMAQERILISSDWGKVTAELIDNEDTLGLSPELTGPTQIKGLTLVKGLASGCAVFHQPRVTIEHVMAEDTEAERQRVYLAFDRMRDQIERMAAQAEFGVGGEHEEVLETYKMFAYDEGWARRINEAIDSGLTAEAAIERVQQRTRMRMRQIDDPLLADRMHDLEDLSNRLLRIVSGQLGTAASQGLRGDAILIARNLGPAELLEYDKRRLKGVILEEGSLTAHVVIVARAMGVPVLGRVRSLRGVIRDGDHCYNRLLWVRPDGELAHYDKRHLFRMIGEHENYAAGERRLDCMLKGWRVRPFICYDLRFPVWSRSPGDCDLLIYVANWPSRRVSISSWRPSSRSHSHRRGCSRRMGAARRSMPPPMATCAAKAAASSS